MRSGLALRCAYHAATSAASGRGKVRPNGIRTDGVTFGTNPSTKNGGVTALAMLARPGAPRGGSIGLTWTRQRRGSPKLHGDTRRRSPRGRTSRATTPLLQVCMRGWPLRLHACTGQPALPTPCRSSTMYAATMHERMRAQACSGDRLCTATRVSPASQLLPSWPPPPLWPQGP